MININKHSIYSHPFLPEHNVVCKQPIVYLQISMFFKNRLREDFIRRENTVMNKLKSSLHHFLWLADDKSLINLCHK